MAYQIILSDTVQKYVRIASPDLKALLKKKLKKLKDAPAIGRPLLKQLSGYYSLRTNKLRIIYKVFREKQILEVHYMGPRRDLYEIVNQMKNGFNQD
jgi:mRNA-degrading endonuclease RelE of RelBE toxin-antitoxin system